jgi:nucleoid-associated protein YgaU
MKRGITGILILTFVGIILTLPGCTSIQDHWTIPDDQPLTTGISAEEAPPSGPVGQDSAQEARLQREEAARRETEAREDARRQEEVRRLLEDLEESHRRAEAEERARQEAESQRSSGGQADAGLKPRYYVVRAGDTFNSIAADPLVYSNRNEWYTLYQANRDKLGNPDNPNLLTPGTVIEIPSIVGEIREGTY